MTISEVDVHHFCGIYVRINLYNMYSPSHEYDLSHAIIVTNTLFLRDLVLIFPRMAGNGNLSYLYWRSVHLAVDILVYHTRSRKIVFLEYFSKRIWRESTDVGDRRPVSPKKSIIITIIVRYSIL